MLYEHCPVTQTCPLLLDPKSGRKWSAALNQYVDTSAEALQQNAKNESKERYMTSDAVVPQQQEAKPSSVPVPGLSSELALLNNAKTVLLTKIKEWGDFLLAERDVDKCRVLLNLIRDAATTIKELSSVIPSEQGT
jgi:hypothetical protein